MRAIDLNPNCLKQAYSNRLGIGYGYESTEFGFTLTVLRVPSVIRLLSKTRLAHSIQLSSRPETVQLYAMFWPSISSSQVASDV